MDENINEAVAYIYQNSNKKEIVLIFTSKEDADLKNIRYRLTKKLPLYMMPNRIQRVDSIPLTLNGKVDIKKITKLVNSSKNCMERTITEVGAEVLRMVRDILRREDIDEHDNFFSAGGTSIEAAFLLNKINTLMRKKISYYDFVIYEDIYELCNLVDNAPLMEETQIHQEKVMSNAEKQIYLASMADEKCTYNMPHIYRIEKEIDIIRLKRAFTRIISENDILHTIFWEDSGTFYKQVLEDYSIDFKYQVSDIKLSNSNIRKFVRAFDLQKDALIRMIVVKEPSTYLLFMDAHHIIFDKTSWDNFFVYLRKYYMIE